MATMTEDELKVAFEALQKSMADDESNLNQFFLLVMGALVMFMQCGFAFLEAGAVRSKNVVNILIKNALDCFCGALSYWAVGFAFAYGTLDEPNPQNLTLPRSSFDINKFIGSKYFFSIYANHLDGGDGYFAAWFFQFVFAATAATIVSGAVAERTQFISYMIYSMIITGFVYPVVSHWGWGGGWMSASEIPSFKNMRFEPPDAPISTVYIDDEPVGYKDFAGSGIVHCTGGIAALMGAIFIGPRIGKFSEDKTVQFDIPGHSVPIASLGGFILFLGFLAFNGGSELAIVGGGGHGQAVAVSFMNTVIGGAAGAMFSIVLNYSAAIVRRETPYWSLLTCINGGLAGMVGLCAGCNDLNPGGAFGIGALSGITLWWMSHAVKMWGVDDPLDAFAVHYGGGLCGVLLTPIFANSGIVNWENCEDQQARYIALRVAAPGLDSADISGFICNQLEYKVWVWNLIGLIAITVWTGGICGLMFYVLNLCGILRIDRDTEIRGLDIKKHGEPAYPTAAYGHGWDKEGDFDMTHVHSQGTAGADGKRDVRALANTFEKKGWEDTIAEDGLIAMALGYRNTNYKGVQTPDTVKEMSSM